MLKQDLKRDLNTAVKEKQETVCSVLRLLLAEISNKEKEKKYQAGEEELTDEEVMGVVISEAKKRKEAISEYEKAEREDLAGKERLELEILQKYLPEQLTEEEVRDIVREVIAETGAQSIQDMGKVMGAVMDKVKGKADGSLVSRIVKELLS